MSESSFSQGAGRLVVAHRGDSSRQAENTLEAFDAAVAAGADAVEFDVRIAADGTGVVMHDPGVERTTDGTGLIRDLTLGEIKRLSIRTADGGTTEVPTLEETLAWLSGRVAVDVEIKNIPGEPGFDAEREIAVEATLRALDRTAFVGPVLLSSFNPLSLARSRVLAPAVPTGLLTTGAVDARAALAYAASEGHPWILPFAPTVLAAGDGFADEARAAGVTVGVWIVDDPATAVGLWRAGVTAVATNDPAALVAARREGVP
ncbi:MAG TPA: glycerophosphodiester phosphodiesterase [Actinomycetota bacterium]